MSFIDALLRPRSVALIGASDDASKTAARPLRFLRASGFAGAVYPVNARRDTVLGEKAWPSVDALPETPEHAYILAPTDSVLETLEQCAKRGVKVATILAAGFAEAGEEGVARERRLKLLAEKSGIRIVGPSSLGVVNLRNGLLLTANAAFAERDLPAGNVLVASHSGTMIGALVSRGKARGIGFGALVSLGNEADVSIGELCAATLDWPDIGGYVLFLETLRKSALLREFALAAAKRGKPVVAYKLGRSRAAAELALSHTGALAGEDDVADAFLRDCGIARVQTLEGLLEALPLAGKIALGTKKRRVAVVTTTGGGAAMIVDQLGVRGIDEVRTHDLTLAGARYDVMKGALDRLLGAHECDLVVAVVGSSARFNPELAVKPIIDSRASAKPLAAFLVPDAPDALLALTRAGVPCFRTPEACADAIAGAFARRAPKSGTGFAEMGEAQALDELASYAILERIGLRHAPAQLYQAGKPLPFPFPAVAKVLSPEVAHKSEAGGVILGIGNDRELQKAAEELQRRFFGKQVLVQQQLDALGEVLVGFRRDPQAGPLVLLAPGGVLAELGGARALRLAPVDLDAARDMIEELKPLRALAGYRGRPAGDLEALAQAIVALSRLAEDPAVAELELNPLLVRRDGVVAVDTLARLASPASGRRPPPPPPGAASGGRATPAV
ncbi:MAG TPA: acetate--CoA ligase family protein [Burkholderiales bacterium]|nr:acetate--CoA ligase family protein [Burkholderiales bacterium]